MSRLDLRTVFMGSPEIAVPSLRLLAQRTQVEWVVTQPDRRSGRGRKMQAPAIKIAAQALGLRICQPERLRDLPVEALAQPDLIVVMAYGALLRRPILEAARWGCINLHASLLPRWRGASPLQAAIRAGDRESGVSVMRMVEALDAGPVYLQRRIVLPDRVNLPWLHDQMAEEAARALDNYLDAYSDLSAHEQDAQQASYCRKLSSADGQLCWQQNMLELDRQIRAYEPSPGCWALLPDQQRLRIRAAEPAPGSVLAPGSVEQSAGSILVGCADGALRICSLQPPGSRSMDAASFLNGHSLPAQLG